MSLSPDEKRALAAVLDAIVPPSGDGRLPGAGELGVADAVEAILRERPALCPGLASGLARLDARAADRASRPFAELDGAARRSVLDAVAQELPAFLGPLVFQTYLAYYRDARVLEALGLEARAPHPQGYAVSPTDFESILDPVRRKAPFYRRP